MIWCRIFLKGKSFTSFAGSDVAYALLFPMETLFESYIACLIKKEINSDKYTVFGRVTPEQKEANTCDFNFKYLLVMFICWLWRVLGSNL